MVSFHDLDQLKQLLIRLGLAHVLRHLPCLELEHFLGQLDQLLSQVVILSSNSVKLYLQSLVLVISML